MSTIKDVWVRPPVLAGVYLLAATALHVLVPAQPSIPASIRPLGLVVAGLGVFLTARSLRLFAQRGTTHNPYGTPSALVETGPFRFSRNPMYLGLTLVLLGIAVMAGAPLLLLAPLVFFLTMHAVFIPSEERALEGSLGPEYLAYKRRVRRWL